LRQKIFFLHLLLAHLHRLNILLWLAAARAAAEPAAAAGQADI